MSRLGDYRTISCCVAELLSSHMEECRPCSLNLKRFKESSNHPGLTDKDLAVDHYFGSCKTWREIRRPLSEFEFCLTNRDIVKMATSPSQDLKDVRSFSRYLRASRRKAKILIKIRD